MVSLFFSFSIFVQIQTEQKQKDITTNQKNEKWGIRWQTSVFTRNPVERDGAVVLGSETLTTESDVRNGSEESCKNGLHVAVPSDERERLVRKFQLVEGLQEGVGSSTNDFERRVVGQRLIVRHWGCGRCDPRRLVEEPAMAVGGIESLWMWWRDCA